MAIGQLLMDEFLTGDSHHHHGGFLLVALVS